MTQGILDYLLIKSQFLLLTKEEIIEKLDTEEILQKYCEIICDIIDNEAFFTTSDEMIDKLSSLVYEKRFASKHNKETVECFNKMLDVTLNYKKSSNSDKILSNAYWLKQSSLDRNLPLRRFPGYDIGSMYNIIKYDYYYADIILNQKENAIIINPIHLLSTINLLASCYPFVFDENPDSLSLCYSYSLLLQDKIYPNGHHIYSKMAKKAQKSLEIIEEKQDIKVTKKYTFDITK